MYWICVYLGSTGSDLGSSAGMGVTRCDDTEIFEKVGHRCGIIHLLIN